ncbi:MAG: alkaline phosphatase family protein [Candidatus Omnitrophica bacterium]|nr:alkaline phosphatase family protein [Candidatus Omnitrophota bacterium]
MEKLTPKSTMKITLRILGAFIICILCALNINSYAQEDTSMPNHSKKKVLIIGIDAMDHGLTTDLMSQGKLPNLKKLAEQGGFKILKTSFPPETPVAWSQIATGMNPGQHNIFDFIRRDAPEYTPKLSLAKQSPGLLKSVYLPYVQGSAFWDVTTQAGVPTTVIRWPVTFPPSQVSGAMLSGLGVPDLRGLLSGYTFYTSQGDARGQGHSRVIVVTTDNPVIETEYKGPRYNKDGKLTEASIPFQIDLAKNTISVDGAPFPLVEKKWGPWIPVTFKTGPFTSISGIIKMYLESKEPFALYVASLQIDPKKAYWPISYPADYSAQLAERIGYFSTIGIAEETGGYIEGKLSKEGFIAQVNDIETERDKQFWIGFEKWQKEGGVYAFVYDSLDRAQHVMWKEDAVTHAFTLDPYLEESYITKDALIGNVLKKLDGNTLLLVISDHGMSSFERAANINTWLYNQGFLTLKSPLQEAKPLFGTVDWSQTKAYSLGFTSLYLNLQGREKSGIVPTTEQDTLLNDIIKKLELWEDPKTGRKVVKEAWKAKDIYKGKNLANAPDIIIGFNEGYRMDWRNPIGDIAPDEIIDNTQKWSGDHLVHPSFVPGIIFSNIPFTRENIRQYDVSATVLSYLGIKIPQDVEGESVLKIPSEK